MHTDRRSLLAGLFVLMTGALLVVGIGFFGRGSLTGTPLEYVIYFSESVDGLRAGAPVLLRGVPVGEVRRIQVHVDTNRGVVRTPVIVRFETDRIMEMGEDLPQGARGEEDVMDRLITQGLRARLEMQSFVTGQLRVGLDLFPKSPVVLVGVHPSLPEFPAHPSKLEELSQRLERLELDTLVKKTTETVEGINETVNSEEMKEAIRSVTEAMRAIKEFVSGLNGVMSPFSSLTGQGAQSLMHLSLAHGVPVGYPPEGEGSSHGPSVVDRCATGSEMTGEEQC
ncbi:MAG: MCE family protein [Magnetococcales bacterium]|nr:MCE family protein [Magnetococcales bacterium]